MLWQNSGLEVEGHVTACRDVKADKGFGNCCSVGDKEGLLLS